MNLGQRSIKRHDCAELKELKEQDFILKWDKGR